MPLNIEKANLPTGSDAILYPPYPGFISPEVTWARLALNSRLCEIAPETTRRCGMRLCGFYVTLWHLGQPLVLRPLMEGQSIHSSGHFCSSPAIS